MTFSEIRSRLMRQSADGLAAAESDDPELRDAGLAAAQRADELLRDLRPLAMATIGNDAAAAAGVDVLVALASGRAELEQSRVAALDGAIEDDQDAKQGLTALLRHVRSRSE